MQLLVALKMPQEVASCHLCFLLNAKNCTIFTALHGMQMRPYDEILSVRPSVCLSNACIV